MRPRFEKIDGYVVMIASRCGNNGRIERTQERSMIGNREAPALVGNFRSRLGRGIDNGDQFHLIELPNQSGVDSSQLSDADNCDP